MATWRGRRAASWWRSAWSRLSAATRTATGGARSLPAFFQQNGWGDAESASGPGSSIAGASLFGAELEALMRDLKRDDFSSNRHLAFSLLLEHDLFRKPVPTFRDHALSYQRMMQWKRAVPTKAVWWARRDRPSSYVDSAARRAFATYGASWRRRRGAYQPRW